MGRSPQAALGTVGTELSTVTNWPLSADSSAASMMSRTCRPSSPEAIWGRSSAMARTISSSPRPRPTTAPFCWISIQGCSNVFAVAEFREGFHVGGAAGESVRVGDDDRALGAVDLHDTVPLQRRVEAQQTVRLLTALEHREHLKGGGHLHREPGAGVRSGAYLALGVRLHARGRDAVHGAEQTDQCGEVVGAHIQQRTGTAGEQELRAGMPQVRALGLE